MTSEPQEVAWAELENLTSPPYHHPRKTTTTNQPVLPTQNKIFLLVRPKKSVD